ncbi:membrane protease subunit, stomatin/prohibitin [Haloarcula hispanica N601]|uniref:Prohibitin family protein n=3 Tax=Haloarcula hispanica TaxID=51589 RepID=A0A482SYQ1_HALHI|nr:MULTISPECIES: prohibitin family protein [Haloarcula]AEM56538.1 membrane protease subunit, stomatin/prohibitin [Haloarcula hispanica ATCC 33960]AHB65344.1 membrane protease subunit, stomatin/prohibitin [Haloarcula hispanica N601]KAA9409256.1 prohibitin family protein [Haloarcula hispanica]KZX48197.1 membrane protease subunit, stomatin/prohibitin [Haloarcula sp. K1]MCJ0618303.1 prohibitin family protein [Haloarcula hispanica]
MSDIPDPGPDSGSDIDIDVGRGLRIGVSIVVALAVATALFGGYHQVPEGHVGVQKSFGAVTGAEFQPGAHIIVPVKDSVQDVEIRPRTYTMANTEGEGDRAAQSDAVTVQTINGTTVDIDITVRYKVEEADASGFVTEWRNVEQAEERLIRPSVRSQLRDEAAGIQTSEIYTNSGRERLGEAAQQKLESAFEGEALVLEEVQVRDVDLPDSYDQALNDKEIAKQRVEEKKFEIQQAEREKKRQEIQAEADARVIEIRGEALRDNPVVLKQQYVQSIDDSDKVILATDDEGTPIILQTGRSSGGNTSSADTGFSTNVTNATGGN